MWWILYFILTEYYSALTLFNSERYETGCLLELILLNKNAVVDLENFKCGDCNKLGL